MFEWRFAVTPRVFSRSPPAANDLLRSLAEIWTQGEAKLRVVAGNLRGRRLAPAPPGVRPTSDRVRESIFARLGDLDGVGVLDLFAGTGALGIEALSRGAKGLVAVDRSYPSVAVIERNLDDLGVVSQAKVIRAEAQTAIRRLAVEGQDFDLVFLDPPYADLTEAPAVLEALVTCDILRPGAVVVVEGPKRHSLPAIAGLALDKMRRYGDTVVYWLRVDPVSSSQVE